jgi:hypothetical protein
MSRPRRRVCGLCGRSFAVSIPASVEETARDVLCPECLGLPLAPKGFGEHDDEEAGASA